MVVVILIVIGLCLGSFVNAFVWRFRTQALLADPELDTSKQARKDRRLTPEALSIAKGRSMCAHCHHPLAPRDLIPVVSYVMLRGKCRYCRKHIQDTPLPELVTLLLFVVSYLVWPEPLQGGGLFAFGGWLVFLVGFVALALYDFRWFELPHKIVLPLIALAVLYNVVLATVYGGGADLLLRAGAGALIGGGIFFALYHFSPKQKLDDGTEISTWIGGGDITLGTLLGLLVGGPGGALLLIFTASLIGTLVALPLMAVGKATRSSHLPFGPYLLLAAVIVRLWGEQIINWYVTFSSGV